MYVCAGVERDVGTYNIMLRIYNNNDHTIVPSEFLEQMKANDVYPNMVSGRPGNLTGYSSCFWL